MTLWDDRNKKLLLQAINRLGRSGAAAFLGISKNTVTGVIHRGNLEIATDGITSIENVAELLRDLEIGGIAPYVIADGQQEYGDPPFGKACVDRSAAMDAIVSAVNTPAAKRANRGVKWLPRETSVNLAVETAKTAVLEVQPLNEEDTAVFERLKQDWPNAVDISQAGPRVCRTPLWDIYYTETGCLTYRIYPVSQRHLEETHRFVCGNKLGDEQINLTCLGCHTLLTIPSLRKR